MPRVFVNRDFSKWAQSEGIDDADILKAGEEAHAGQFEASLGGYLYKKRVARKNEGKSGGYRTILCFTLKGDERVFFLYGFPKSAKSNINSKEKIALRELARHAVKLTEEQITAMKANGGLRELETENE